MHSAVDWSNAAGIICYMCDRTWENENSSGGIYYATNFCPACRGNSPYCRSCKRYMHKDPPPSAELDGYCCECVGCCDVCCQEFEPRFIGKHCTTLDPIIRSMIGNEVEDRYGENAKDGVQKVELCKDCHREWKEESLLSLETKQPPSQEQTTEIKTTATLATTTRMDEKHCRSCKEPCNKNLSELDNYCLDCVGACTICDAHFYPQFSTPMDPISRSMLEETGWSVEDWFGEDANKDGTENYIELCKNCKSEWETRSTKLEQQKETEESGTKRTLTAATTTIGTTKRTKTIKKIYLLEESRH